MGGVDGAVLASAFDSTSLDSVPCVGRWLTVLPWCGEPALSAAKARELRKLVLAGVPECVRGDVWMRLSQARSAMLQDTNNTYQVCSPLLFFSSTVKDSFQRCFLAHRAWSSNLGKHTHPTTASSAWTCRGPSRQTRFSCTKTNSGKRLSSVYCTLTRSMTRSSHTARA